MDLPRKRNPGEKQGLRVLLAVVHLSACDLHGDQGGQGAAAYIKLELWGEVKTEDKYENCENKDGGQSMTLADVSRWVCT